MCACSVASLQRGQSFFAPARAHPAQFISGHARLRRVRVAISLALSRQQAKAVGSRAIRRNRRHQVANSPDRDLAGKAGIIGAACYLSVPLRPAWPCQRVLPTRRRIASTGLRRTRVDAALRPVASACPPGLSWLACRPTSVGPLTFRRGRMHSTHVAKTMEMPVR